MAYTKRKMWREKDENGDFPELNEKQLEKLKNRAWNYCLWSLEQGNKTEKQLRDKMKGKNCPEDIATATIERLISYKYVNDEDFTKSFIESKRYMKWGDRKISMELSNRGITPEIIETYLVTETDEDSGETEYDRAYEFAEKKVRVLPQSLDRQKKMNRVVGALSRRGFSLGNAYQIVGELIDQYAVTEEFEDSEGDENEA